MRTACFKFAFASALIVLGWISPAGACPDINGLADLNCDGRIQITLFGDSITRGAADASGLGYPGRLNLLLPGTTVSNFGISGERTSAGRNRIFSVYTVARGTDYGVILEGVNDYFETTSVSNVRNNLVSMLQNARASGGVVMLATLVENKRGFQRPWVVNLNNQIRPFTQVDFFSLGQGIVSNDLLHPNGPGYQQMAEYLIPILQQMSEANRPIDSDGDGVYDFAEIRFGTDPFNPDTDGDGLSDGLEIFTYGTNPLLKDSDGDGLEDGYEVNVLGSNPADPRPGAPRGVSIEVIVD